MGDCNETLKELETFLDGELSPELLADIRSHLGDCPNCLEAFDFHAELKAVIAAKCTNDELPPGLMVRIAQCFQTDLGADGTIS